MRYAVVWVPDWPIVAASAEGLVDASHPCAIFDGRGIVVASPSARQSGVRRGMRRRVAQRVCPELALCAADEERDARAFEAVVQSVEDVVAVPSILRPGLILIEAAGPVRHYGSEEALASELVGAVARQSGAECYVGIADGLLGVIMAARGGIIVPAGGSAEFLAPAPIGSLQFAALTKAARSEVSHLMEILGQLGIHTVGELAGLPVADVAGRFGTAGLRAHALASGAAVAVIPGGRPQGDVLVARELDPPIERSDAAAFAARTVAENLAERLRGRACSRLRVSVRTTDGNELSRLWTIEASLMASEITDRVRWQLDGWLSGRSGRRPSAPLHMVELVAEDVRGAASRIDPLWGKPTHSQESAERAALRLQGMLGPSGVCAPVLEGGRDPRSRVRLVVWGDDTAPRRRRDAPWPGRLPSPAPSTVLDEPEVIALRDADGRPVVVNAYGQISAPPAQIVPAPESPHTAKASSVGSEPHLELPHGEIVEWAGPWPISERWWDTPVRAAWMQITPAAGPSLLLSTTDGGWQIEGVYD